MRDNINRPAARIIAAGQNYGGGKMQGTCTLCGNTSSFDKESLKGSTIRINGCPVVMCCYCEDEILKKTAKRKGIIIKLESGEVLSIIEESAPKRVKTKTWQATPPTNEVIIVGVYWSDDKESWKRRYDEDSMREEFDDKIGKILRRG